MTNFWSLFKQMWSQKQRYISLILVINIFTIVFMTFFKIIMPDDYYAHVGIVKYWQDSYMWLTIYIDIAFCAIACWQNEKINTSQTWHLIVADERKIYLANIFSSLVACGVFFFLQQIINAFLLLPSYGAESLVHIYRDFQLWSAQYDPWDNVLFHWFFIVMIILFIYFFVSFTNFTSKLITNYLPFKSTLWIRLLVIVVLVIVAVYFGLIIMSHLQSFIDAKKGSVDPIWLDDILLLVVNLVFGSIDLWFVHSFVEPKIANY